MHCLLVAKLLFYFCYLFSYHCFIIFSSTLMHCDLLTCRMDQFPLLDPAYDEKHRTRMIEQGEVNFNCLHFCEFNKCNTYYLFYLFCRCSMSWGQWHMSPLRPWSMTSAICPFWSVRSLLPLLMYVVVGCHLSNRRRWQWWLIGGAPRHIASTCRAERWQSLWRMRPWSLD